MTMETALPLLMMACVGAGTISAARAWTHRVEGLVPDRLVTLLLLLCVVNVLHPLMDFRNATTEFWILEPLQFLLPMGVVWYLRALRRTKVFRWVDLPVVGLPLLFLALSAFPWDPRLFSLVMWLTMAVFSTVLLIPLAHQIARYRKDLESVYSNLAGVDPGWLQALLAAMGVLFLVYAVLAVVLVHAMPGFPIHLVLGTLMGGLTLYLSWMSLGRIRRLTSETVEPRLPQKQLVEWVEQVQQRLKTGRIHLNPELTLDDLAREVGLTRHETSAALNQGLGVSFFDLVNGLRVAEFQRLCGTPSKRDDKILTLALEAGFNSKPAFNQIFKKTTGQTPSEFRKGTKIGS